MLFEAPFWFSEQISAVAHTHSLKRASVPRRALFTFHSVLGWRVIEWNGKIRVRGDFAYIRNMEFKIKMAASLFIIASFACVAFCIFVFLCESDSQADLIGRNQQSFPTTYLILATMGSGEDERRAIVNAMEECVEEATRHGTMKNITLIMRKCAVDVSGPDTTGLEDQDRSHGTTAKGYL